MSNISTTTSFPLFFRRSLKSSESHDGEKKKSKGGFLNLIKRSSKSDKSDKHQGTASSTGASPAPASSIPEEPSSPKLAVKSPALEPKSRYGSNKTESLPIKSVSMA